MGEREREPGATFILGIWSDLWLEHFYKVPLHKCPLNNIPVIPNSFRLSVHFFLPLFDRVPEVTTFNDIIKPWIVFPMPVFDEPHQASAGTWQQSAEKKNPSFIYTLHCCILWQIGLGVGKATPAGDCSTFGLSPELFLLWYVWLTCSKGDR